MKHSFAYRAPITLLLLAFSSILCAAERPVPPKPDPILADLKMTPSAAWCIDGPGEQPPQLKVRVKLTGTAASLTSGVLCVRWDSVLDENGKSYHRRSTDGTCFSARDPDGVELVLQMHNRPPIKSIRKLSGSALLHTGGEHRKLLVENAFAAPGKPVKNASLDALGMTLAADHAARADWDPASWHREHISLSVKWKDNPIDKDKICRLVGFKILDEEETIRPYETTCSHSTRWDEIKIGCKTRLSPQAQIELTVHTGAREVWVPFEFADIPVPSVPSNLDVPAVPGEESLEAQPVAADDPIVAGLKIAPETPPGQLLIRLSGKPIALTSRFGEIDIDEAVDEAGNRLFIESDAAQMRPRFSFPEFQANRPAAYLWRTGFPWPERIRLLRGSVALRAGGQLKTIIVKDILKHVEDPLTDETLKSLGISARVVFHNEQPGPEAAGKRETLRIELAWNRDTPVYDCQLTDAQGKPPAKGPVFAFDQNNSLTLDGYFDSSLPADTQLRITVHKDSRKVRVPFVLKDIETTPVPKEQE